MANGTFNPLDPGAEPTGAEGSPNFDPTGGINPSDFDVPQPTVNTQPNIFERGIDALGNFINRGEPVGTTQFDTPEFQARASSPQPDFSVPDTLGDPLEDSQRAIEQGTEGTGTGTDSAVASGFRTPEQEAAARELSQQLGESSLAEVTPPPPATVQPLTASQIAEQPTQFLDTADTLLGTAREVGTTAATTPTQVTAPTVTTAPTATPTLVTGQQAGVTAAQLTAPSQTVAEIQGQVSPEAQAVAAQATLDPQATLQFQLEQLYQGFQPGQTPPAWASPAMRRASSIMQSRGLGSSSMAAAAISQAIVESAVPIAQADAQKFATIQLQNLNNQQQTALSNAATFAAMDTKNLDARVTAQVENSRSFLQVDTQNLNNAQQAATLTAQAHNQALLSDQAASNAAEQLNTQVQVDIDKFFATLGTQVQENNVNRVTAVEKFNVEQANAIETFNVKQQDLREQFNAEMRTAIDASNAQWRRNITTINNQAQMQTNEFNAREVNNRNIRDYNNLFQTYRDVAARIWMTAENNENRAMQLAASQLAAAASGGRAGGGSDSSIGGILGSVAGIIGGFSKICAVAQEVYGTEDTRWLKFRWWMYHDSPKWFKKLYIKHGVSIAKFIHNKPLLKQLVKYFMDKQIKKVHHYD